MPNVGVKNLLDYKLSKYACYLIVQNVDSRKAVVALSQTFFAVQTRKQEILEKTFDEMSELEKRLINREITRKENTQLNKVAKNAHYEVEKKVRNAIIYVKIILLLIRV